MAPPAVVIQSSPYSAARLAAATREDTPSLPHRAVAERESTDIGL